VARVPQITAVLVTAAALFALGACADGAANSAGVWVRVNPATVNAGAQTQITATCGQNVNTATVTSTAFGSVTLQASSTVLSASVTIPSSTPKGAFDVRLTCPGTGTANTTLMVVSSMAAQGQGQASNAPGPNTGGGFLAHQPAGADADTHTSPDRSPLVWLSVGLSSLLTAAALAIRNRRRRLGAARSGLAIQEQNDRIDEPGPAPR
jgi:hypothetical protein